MGIPIRVLIVEDSTDDAELVLLQLRRAGYDPVSERVQTAEGMKTALEREPWDLVVSDYTMPRFDAPAALNLLNQSGRDVPFIVVSGSIGEDIAVAMMKTGAHDYVLKQNLARFVSAVQRELREAENRRQQRLTGEAKRRLQIERDALLERLKQENEDLAALTRVTANAVSTLELDDLLRVLLERVLEVMHADTATILLAEGGELRVQASVGAVNLSDSTHVRYVGQCFAGSVAQSMKPAYVEDATTDPLVTDPLIRARGIRSMLGVPLKRNGKLIGVLHADWLTVRPCRDREVHLLEITGERCAAAIQNAQLYQEAKRVNAALTEREAHLRQLSRAVEQTADAVLIADRAGTIQYVNAAFEEATGYSAAEAVGRKPNLLNSGRHEPEFFENLWRTIAAGEPFRATFINRRKSGALLYEEKTITPVKDDRGNITHFVSTAKDITELRLAEQERKRLLDVLEASFNEIYIFDAQTLRFEYANAAALRNLGYSLDGLLMMTPVDLKPEVSEPAFHELIGPLRRHEKDKIVFQTVHRRADGGLYPVEVNLQLVEHDGRAVFLAVINDITERKQKEAELRDSEERFRQLARHIDEVFWITDVAKSQMIYVSPAYENIWGRTCASVIASPRAWLDALHPEDRDRALQAALTQQATGAYDIEFRIVRADGTVRWIHDRAFPVRNEAGEVYRIVGVAIDITVRQEAEKALRESLREKGALLREVHHRVKNNLQVITSLLRLEAGRSEEATARTVLKEMQGRILAMALLHETLYRSGTFASVDLGAYLKQLASQSFRTMNPRPGSIQLDLHLAAVEVGIDQAIPCGLLLNELISNCLKHGFPGDGTGTVRIELLPVDGGPQVRLRVSDTGVGLPADFESKRGRSLGLQLVSDLAKQVGGRLEIEPGPGAAFAVTFAVDNPKASTGGLARRAVPGR